MSFQLIYTSAERGLKSGSRGFTTVAMTEGMPAHCLQLCESMSGYVHVFELNSGNYERNPVAWSHYRIKSGPNEYSVISRVSAHPKDYTGRTNKIAHHLMLEHPRELQSYANGPGDLLGSPFFSQEWSGAPHFLPEGQHPPSTQAKLDPQAGHWQAAGLPTSAAARIAQALEQGTDSPIVLLFEAGSNDDRVGLIQDILDLIPPSKRWEIGFSTYYSMHPTGAEIHIRACAKGTDAARRAARHPRAVVVDIGTGSIEGLQHLPEADAALLSAATNGTIPEWAREPDPPAPQRQQEAAEEPEESPKLQSLPPPRPDRPGAVRKRKPPPPPGRTLTRSGKHSSKTPKELIGVLVGLLLLLSAGGVVLVTRDAGKSRGQSGIDKVVVDDPPAPPVSDPKAKGDVKQEPAAEKIAQDEESQLVSRTDSENKEELNSKNGDPENNQPPPDHEENGEEDKESAEAGGNSGEENAEPEADTEVIKIVKTEFPLIIKDDVSDIFVWTSTGEKKLEKPNTRSRDKGINPADVKLIKTTSDTGSVYYFNTDSTIIKLSPVKYRDDKVSLPSGIEEILKDLKRNVSFYIDDKLYDHDWVVDNNDLSIDKLSQYIESKKHETNANLQKELDKLTKPYSTGLDKLKSMDGLLDSIKENKNESKRQKSLDEFDKEVKSRIDEYLYVRRTLDNKDEISPVVSNFNSHSENNTQIKELVSSLKKNTKSETNSLKQIETLSRRSYEFHTSVKNLYTEHTTKDSDDFKFRYIWIDALNQALTNTVETVESDYRKHQEINSTYDNVVLEFRLKEYNDVTIIEIELVL